MENSKEQYVVQFFNDSRLEWSEIGCFDHYQPAYEYFLEKMNVCSKLKIVKRIYQQETVTFFETSSKSR